MNLPGRPKGNPGELRHAAASWRAAANEVSSVGSSLTSIMQIPGWNGAAAGAFHGSIGDLAAAIGKCHDGLQQIAGGLDHVADQIESAQRRYDQALAAATVTTAFGIGLTVVTLGASDAMAAAADTALVGTLGAIAVALDGVVEGAGALFLAGADLCISAGSAYSVLFANSVISQGVGQAVTGGDPANIDLGRTAETVGLGRFLGPVTRNLAPSFIPNWATNAFSTTTVNSYEQAAHDGTVNPLKSVIAGSGSAASAGASTAVGK